MACKGDVNQLWKVDRPPTTTVTSFMRLGLVVNLGDHDERSRWYQTTKFGFGILLRASFTAWVLGLIYFIIPGASILFLLSVFGVSLTEESVIWLLLVFGIGQFALFCNQIGYANEYAYKAGWNTRNAAEQEERSK
jgi:hypothetical protein